MPSVKFLLYFFVPHFQLILGYKRHVCSPPLFITSGFCVCDEHMIIGVFSWHYSCDKAVFMAADWIFVIVVNWSNAIVGEAYRSVVTSTAPAFVKQGA